MSEKLAVVVIGRNEGERLRRCLGSLMPAGVAVVYVDSGSSDGSVGLARSMGADVVELDLSRPFSAGRARNEGIAKVAKIASEVEWVQFIDGDCMLMNSWLDKATLFLEEHSDYAIVCGRLCERFPEASIYNRLCDIEWNTPIGDTIACGGIAMIRIMPLMEVGGYDPNVIAGEEPELCVRLRRANWKVRRLDVEMALHDAAMSRFGQWWKRSVRGGYAFALGAAMHGKSPERHWVKEVRSNWFWGLFLPILAFGLAWPTWGISLSLLAGYPVLVWRIFGHMRRRGFCAADARLYAYFCMLSKFAGVQGQCRFYVGRLFSRPAKIIEYKGPQPAADI